MCCESNDVHVYGPLHLHHTARFLAGFNNNNMPTSPTPSSNVFFPRLFFFSSPPSLLLPLLLSSPIADLNNTSTPNASQGRARSAFKVAAGMPRVGCLLGGSGLFAGTGRAGASSGGSIMTAGRIFPRLAMSTGPAPSQVMYRFQRENRSQSCLSFVLLCVVFIGVTAEARGRPRFRRCAAHVGFRGPLHLERERVIFLRPKSDFFCHALLSFCLPFPNNRLICLTPPSSSPAPLLH